jgi:hypothetical protein
VHEKTADVAEGKVGRMAFGAEEDEPARPVGETFPGTILTEASHGGLSGEVEQARGLRRGAVSRCGELGASGFKGLNANARLNRVAGKEKSAEP